MAQSTKARRNVGSLARRFGITGRRGVAFACIGLMMLLCLGYIYSLSTQSSLMIDRAEDHADDLRQDELAEDSSKTKDEARHEAEASDVVAVHVDGAVASPGMYLIEGELVRVNDAIAEAGGLLPEADTSSINLASPIVDGQKVYVPREGESEATPAQTAIAQDAQAPSPQASGAVGSRVNINSATVQELQVLPGVGEATATAIVEERETNGLFTSPEDLMRVSGIGQKKLQKMRESIDV